MKKIKPTLILLMIFTTSLYAAEKFKHFKDTLVVGYNINPPFIFLDHGQPAGLSYRLWNEIVQHDNNTLYIYKQTPLDSLLSGLSEGSIDIAISPLTITSERTKFIDFSVPYFISNSGVLVKKSGTFKRFMDYTSIFFNWRFLKLILSLLLLITVFGILVWLFERKKNPDEFGDGMKGFFHGFWWSAVTMTTVGYGDKTPKTLGGRTIGMIWMFLAIILLSSITAGITSTLTINQMNLASGDLNTFKNYRIGTVKNSATERWLNDNFFHNVKTYHSYDELLDGLRNDEIEMVAYDEPVLRYTLAHDPDNAFELINVKYNHSMYAFGFNPQLDKKRKKQISIKLLDVLGDKRWKEWLKEFNLDTEN